MKKIKYENESKLYDDINEYIKDKNFDILLISTPRVMKEIFDDRLIKTNKNILISSRMLRKNDEDNVYIELINNDVYSVTVDGPSGSGKSTMCSLISRFWDVDQGSISIGDVNIKNYTLASLMALISTVFQNVYLFQDTIENNIKFGKPQAKKEEVIEVAKKAKCHDFIMNLPEGYQTIIGEGVTSLSGGERQRISIARAILKDAPIILLDEATASLDVENESLIQEALSELIKEKTAIVIAHRLRTIRNANKIVLFNDGKIEALGKDEELCKSSEFYKAMLKKSNIQ